MGRSFASRVVALAIATLLGTYTPGLALAHGYAHHEESEHAAHDREHHHGEESRTTDASSDASSDVSAPSIRATNESKDHAHPQLAHALSVRMETPVFVLPSDRASVPNEIVFVGTASLLLTAAPARAAPPDAPPRQPRAPPVG